MVVDSGLGYFRDCAGNKIVGYEEGCISIPASRQPRVTGSIMYGYQSIEEVNFFMNVFCLRIEISTPYALVKKKREFILSFHK